MRFVVGAFMCITSSIMMLLNLRMCVETVEIGGLSRKWANVVKIPETRSDLHEYMKFWVLVDNAFGCSVFFMGNSGWTQTLNWVLKPQQWVMTRNIQLLLCQFPYQPPLFVPEYNGRNIDWRESGLFCPGIELYLFLAVTIGWYKLHGGKAVKPRPPTYCC
jgi:hypothetical protein